MNKKGMSIEVVIGIIIALMVLTIVLLFNGGLGDTLSLFLPKF